jgi:hypothetical protein
MSNLSTLIMEHQVHGVAVARTYAVGLDALPTSGDSLVALQSVSKITPRGNEALRVIENSWNEQELATCRGTF